MEGLTNLQGVTPSSLNETTKSLHEDEFKLKDLPRNPCSTTLSQDSSLSKVQIPHYYALNEEYISRPKTYLDWIFSTDPFKVQKAEQVIPVDPFKGIPQLEWILDTSNGSEPSLTVNTQAGRRMKKILSMRGSQSTLAKTAQPTKKAQEIPGSPAHPHDLELLKKWTRTGIENEKTTAEPHANATEYSEGTVLEAVPLPAATITSQPPSEMQTVHQPTSTSVQSTAENYLKGMRIEASHPTAAAAALQASQELPPMSEAPATVVPSETKGVAANQCVQSSLPKLPDIKDNFRIQPLAEDYTKGIVLESVPQSTILAMAPQVTTLVQAIPQPDLYTTTPLESSHIQAIPQHTMASFPMQPFPENYLKGTVLESASLQPTMTTVTTQSSSEVQAIPQPDLAATTFHTASSVEAIPQFTTVPFSTQPFAEDYSRGTVLESASLQPTMTTVTTKASSELQAIPQLNLAATTFQTASSVEAIPQVHLTTTTPHKSSNMQAIPQPLTPSFPIQSLAEDYSKGMVLTSTSPQPTMTTITSQTSSEIQAIPQPDLAATTFQKASSVEAIPQSTAAPFSTQPFAESYSSGMVFGSAPQPTLTTITPQADSEVQLIHSTPDASTIFVEVEAQDFNANQSIQPVSTNYLEQDDVGDRLKGMIFETGATIAPQQLLGVVQEVTPSVMATIASHALSEMQTAPTPEPSSSKTEVEAVVAANQTMQSTATGTVDRPDVESSIRKELASETGGPGPLTPQALSEMRSAPPMPDKPTTVVLSNVGANQGTQSTLANLSEPHNMKEHLGETSLGVVHQADVATHCALAEMAESLLTAKTQDSESLKTARKAETLLDTPRSDTGSVILRTARDADKNPAVPKEGLDTNDLKTATGGTKQRRGSAKENRGAVCQKRNYLNRSEDEDLSNSDFISPSSMATVAPESKKSETARRSSFHSKPYSKHENNTNSRSRSEMKSARADSHRNLRRARIFRSDVSLKTANEAKSASRTRFKAKAAYLKARRLKRMMSRYHRVDPTTQVTATEQLVVDDHLVELGPLRAPISVDSHRSLNRSFEQTNLKQVLRIYGAGPVDEPYDKLPRRSSNKGIKGAIASVKYGTNMVEIVLQNTAIQSDRRGQSCNWIFTHARNVHTTPIVFGKTVLVNKSSPAPFCLSISAPFWVSVYQEQVKSSEGGERIRESIEVRSCTNSGIPCYEMKPLVCDSHPIFKERIYMGKGIIRVDRDVHVPEDYGLRESSKFLSTSLIRQYRIELPWRQIKGQPDFEIPRAPQITDIHTKVRSDLVAKEKRDDSKVKRMKRIRRRNLSERRRTFGRRRLPPPSKDATGTTRLSSGESAETARSPETQEALKWAPRSGTLTPASSISVTELTLKESYIKNPELPSVRNAFLPRHNRMKKSRSAADSGILNSSRSESSCILHSEKEIIGPHKRSELPSRLSAEKHHPMETSTTTKPLILKPPASNQPLSVDKTQTSDRDSVKEDSTAPLTSPEFSNYSDASERSRKDKPNKETKRSNSGQNTTTRKSRSRRSRSCRGSCSKSSMKKRKSTTLQADTDDLVTAIVPDILEKPNFQDLVINRKLLDNAMKSKEEFEERSGDHTISTAKSHI